MHSEVHHTHPDIIKRLRRIEGQVRSIATMIEARRSCLDVAQQLSAATAALESAKAVFIRDHIDHCLSGEPGADQREQLIELKEITKYL